jgi:hypothetical protein
MRRSLVDRSPDERPGWRKAFYATDERYRAVVWLKLGEPVAELVVQQHGATVWQQLLTVEEVALFAAGSDNALAAYMNEVIVNIEALRAPRVQ